MTLNLHNKINININGKSLTFYNTIFNNIFEKIANLDTFFDKLAIGNGFCENFNNNYHLGNFVLLSNFISSSHQFDPSENEVFFTKTLSINSKNINSNYITEAGITSKNANENNPEIYNYFSFINEEFPNGIYVGGDEEILISVKIYLNVNSLSNGLLTKGDNPFVKLLLGGGCNNKELFVARGNDLSNNEFIHRSNSYLNQKYPCSISHNTNDNVLKLEFSGDLSTGVTNEIVFILDDIVFARINTKILNKETTHTDSFLSKACYVIDLGIDVSKIESVYNTNTSQYESNYYKVNYANNFAAKTHLPFNNLFDINTPRFLSLDGDKLFFILNDIVYLYKNINYNIESVFAINLQIQNIFKITSFDDFVFVFTKTAPCVHAYKISNNTLVKCNLDLSNFDSLSILETFTLIDIVQGKNGLFMLGFVVPNGESTDAYSIFLTYDEENGFVFESYLKTSNYVFTYMLPFHKNNFSDAQIIYLQAGQTSSKCRRAVHGIDKSSSDGYNVTAYYYTYSTINLCVKTRAVVVEKSITPNLWLYYYPQVYRFNLAQLGDAEKNYISTNLLYLMQKMPDGSYKAYSLVGYDNPEIFSKGIPSEIDQSKIIYIEFLIDTVLFFMNDPNEPIVAYNLDIVGTCLENVTTKNQTYNVTYTKQTPLGGASKGVSAKFSADISV